MSLSRKERRAAERASRKAERRQLVAAAAATVGFVSHKEDIAPAVGFVSHEPLSEANRANAGERTGRLLPVVRDSDERTGRLLPVVRDSKESSFNHGLYSKQLILKSEDVSELAALKATLFNEHQPTNQTEALLVQEMAEHYWLMQRYRRFETKFLNLESPQPREAEAAQRMHGRAERSFYKAFKTLREIQKERKREERTLDEGRAVSEGPAVSGGFVPTENTAAANGFVPTEECNAIGVGFVPSKEHTDAMSGRSFFASKICSENT